MDVLQMSKEKVLQHIVVTAHLAAPQSWSAPAICFFKKAGRRVQKDKSQLA
jgi:hypothetical protein